MLDPSSGRHADGRDARSVRRSHDPARAAAGDPRGDGRRRTPIAGVQRGAAFAGQVWVATRAGVLIRLGIDGRQLDEHALPIDPDGLPIRRCSEAPRIARVVGDTAEVWGPTQSPTITQVFVADALGIGVDDVQVNVTLLGGAFGRRMGDACAQAAQLAQRVKRPVKLIWTRESEMTQGWYRPIYSAKAGVRSAHGFGDCRLLASRAARRFLLRPVSSSVLPVCNAAIACWQCS